MFGNAEPLHRTANPPQAGKPVDERGKRCAERGNLVDVPEQIVAQRTAAGLVVVVLELVFEFRHVHAAGTFRFAALAGQAQVERLVDGFFGQGAGFDGCGGGDERAAGWRVRAWSPFFAGGLEGGTITRPVAADALPIALFDGGGQAAARSAGRAARPKRAVAFAVTQVGIHRRSGGRFARVEQVVRVGGLFERGEGLHQGIAAGLTQPFGARQAVTMFGGTSNRPNAG